MFITPWYNQYSTTQIQAGELCHKRIIMNMQRLQNKAACIVLIRNRTENYFSSFKYLRLLTRTMIHRCILIFKILSDSIPVYFENHFIKNTNVHNFNTRYKENFILPTVIREFGKWTFRILGAKDYNDLPSEIKNASTLASFKIRIKQYFLSYLQFAKNHSQYGRISNVIFLSKLLIYF